MQSPAFEGFADALEYDTVVLRPGDVLYVPRGVPHGAWTEESSSLHLTAGLRQPTWLDVVKAGVDTALRGCEKKLAFRTVCPAIFPGSADGHLRSTFENMIEVLCQKLVEADSRALVRQMMSKTPRMFRGSRRASVQAGTLVVRNPSLYFSGKDDRGPWLEFDGKVLRFPGSVTRAVEFVTSTPRFSVREIPGLSDAERIVLANRLLHEGFLHLAEPGTPVP
jgi:hypothetical protein